MKLKVTCTDINCPERTGGVCYMTKLGKWEDALDELWDLFFATGGDHRYRNQLMSLKRFIQPQISLAKQQGYAEGVAFKGKTKREWYQKGYSDGLNEKPPRQKIGESK